MSTTREATKSSWRPISEYPTVVGENNQGPIVLARTSDKEPFLVVLREGHFIICPGVPVWYGGRQFNFMTADHVVEFMEIPA